jgi:aryl-alcohol dehydrogenase-like predicted oxidoreductase
VAFRQIAREKEKGSNAMQYVRLGNSGLSVSRFTLGMMTYGTPKWRPWVLDEVASRPLVRAAIDAGINFLDTADMYSAGMSEELTGKFVREFCRREEVVIATKVFYPIDLAFHGGNAPGPKFRAKPNTSGLSRKRIFHAIDTSLRRLGTDYVDLYQIHRFDPATPVEETMEALHDVVRSGKVRYIGASSMFAWQFATMQHVAERHGWTKFVSMQNHYNLVYREEEREMNPYCRATGVGLLPWSPLARGFLAGNRKPGEGGSTDKSAGATARAATDEIAQKFYYRESDFRVVDTVSQLALERGVSNAALAYAWLLHQTGVSSPIIGLSKPGQLEQAVEALDIKLTADDLGRLEAPYQPHPVIGHT